MSSDEDRSRIDRVRDFDCSWGMPGVGRFRVNILRQRSSFMIVMRVIPFTVPTIASLTLPDILQAIAESESGMVLVTGGSGCGRAPPWLPWCITSIELFISTLSPSRTRLSSCIAT